MKQEVKFEDGVLKVSVADGVDKDNDGKMSLSAKFEVDIDFEETIKEVFKSDPAWLKAVITKLGAKIK